MAANVTFFYITGARTAFSYEGRRSENITVGGGSVAGSLLSESGQYLRITTDTACFVDVGENPDATTGGTQLEASQTLDLGPMPEGISVAVMAK